MTEANTLELWRGAGKQGADLSFVAANTRRLRAKQTDVTAGFPHACVQGNRDALALFFIETFRIEQTRKQNNLIS
jgi:hypothetical protein